MDMYDDNDDPIQYGLEGYDETSDGLTYMRGPCLGVVLSVHYSDDSENLLYKFLSSDDIGAQRGSYIEASVLLLYGGVEMFVELNNVAIMQGKSGFRGMSEGEPPDWTEDIPNGCTADELDDFYARGATAGVDTLSGDWVVVDFIGGVLQTAVITQWFPNPRNKRDAATKDVGKRFLLRRNNSEIQIDKNGDFHITHRVGQYIQMKGEDIVIKHRNGQVISFDDDGSVSITDKSGSMFLLDNGSISAGNGKSFLSLDQDVASLSCDGGDVTLQADQINLMAAEVNAYGNKGGRYLANEDLVSVTSALADNVDAMNNALITFMVSVGAAGVPTVPPLPPNPLTPLVAPAAQAVVDLGKVKLALVDILAAYVLDNADQTLRTTVFKGE